MPSLRRSKGTEAVRSEARHAGRGGGGADSASTTMIWSSNGNPIAMGSDLGRTDLDLGLTVFLVFKNQFLMSAGNS
jgi:hypothetical protein